MSERRQSSMRRASELRERFGLMAVLAEGFDKAILRPASLNVLHVLALEGDDARPRPIDPDYTLRFLTEEDAARFSADPSNELGPEFVERIRGGHDLCFAALHGDRLASYAWYALGSVEAEHAAGTALSIPADIAYLYKGFTHPELRGRHLYPACMSAALSALRARGIDRLIAFVHWSNRAALRSCERLGYRRLGRLVVGPFGPVRTPEAARALGLVFGADAEIDRARRSGSA